LGAWNVPGDPSADQSALGTIAGDHVRAGGDRTVLRDLARSPYATRDPWLREAVLATLVVHVVRTERQPIGVLMGGFDDDRVPPSEDLEVLDVLARSLGAQEERRASEDALRESEERYRRLVESLHDRLIYARRVDGVFTYTAPSSVHVVGYTADEII